MDQRINETMKMFISQVLAFLPVQKIILYGSYARGTQRTDSDIDLAIVVDQLSENWIKVTGRLFLLAAELDIRIEPNLIISSKNKSEFLESMYLLRF